jgi:hypothetical protein
MRKQVEAWHRRELTDVTAKVVSNMPIDLTALKLRLQIGEHVFQQRVWVRSNTHTFLASDLGRFRKSSIRRLIPLLHLGFGSY